jgi:hypothetical protein
MPSGRQCEAYALKGENFCYFHGRLHRAAKKPVNIMDSIEIPVLEDRCAIQLAITQTLRAIVNNTIDRHRASLLLYGLQLALQSVDRKNYAIGYSTVQALSQTPDGDELALDVEDEDEDEKDGKDEKGEKEVDDEKSDEEADDEADADNADENSDSDSGGSGDPGSCDDRDDDDEDEEEDDSDLYDHRRYDDFDDDDDDDDDDEDDDFENLTPQQLIDRLQYDEKLARSLHLDL